MYNKIAYTSLIIGIFFALIICADIIFFDKTIIFHNNLNYILPIVIMGLGQIYYKLNTTPITEAISEWWENRNKKDNLNNKNIKAKDYKEYKEKKEE